MSFFHWITSQKRADIDPSMPKDARWSIGIYTGLSPLDVTEPPGISNPVLTADQVTDIPAGFVADPFMIKEGDSWHMFFEVLNTDTQLGEIACASSSDGISWRYERKVLSESFSLSYPFIFKHETDFFMIPECNASKSIILYRSVDYPYSWKPDTVLLKRQRFSDSTMFIYQNHWWLFTATRSRPINNGRLRLFYADRLRGPWKEHPKSPVVDKSPNSARPAGRVIVSDKDLIRFAQDDYPVYGKQVWAFRITRLDTRHYEEEPAKDTPIIQASGKGWNQYGMHTIDAHRINEEWIACVDGLGTGTQNITL